MKIMGTLPSRKFARLVSSTGRVGLSISCLVSNSSNDFPDLGGLARLVRLAPAPEAR